MSKAFCTICKIKLDSENCSPCIIKNGGQCRICHTKWSREWRAKNLDKVRKSNRAYQLRYPDRVLESGRKYRIAHPEKAYEINRKRDLKLAYGMTLEDFNRRVEDQNNKCAICGGEFIKTPNVDHNHISGKTRDLLCIFCNFILGNAHDSIEILEKAIQYLKKHGD